MCICFEHVFWNVGVAIFFLFLLVAPSHPESREYD
jgi:hypothetical protein